MTFRDSSQPVPHGWLGFELSVLRRLDFDSVAIPYGGEPDLGVHLKRWGKRVAINDQAQWAWTKATARISNNTEQLGAEALQLVLEDAYVPGYKLRNPALREWFSEPEAWWFDNVRANIERLEDPHQRALALTLGMSVGDYARSFTEETGELRQPLSRVLRRLQEMEPPPVNNNHLNLSLNLEARDFLAEQEVESTLR